MQGIQYPNRYWSSNDVLTVLEFHGTWGAQEVGMNLLALIIFALNIYDLTLTLDMESSRYESHSQRWLPKRSYMDWTKIKIKY